MKFSVISKDLNSKLKILYKVCNNKTATGELLRVTAYQDQGTLVLASCDGFNYLACKCGSKIDKGGEFYINYGLLKRLSFPNDDTPIFFDVNEELKINWSGSKAKLSVSTNQSFPTIPKVAKEKPIEGLDKIASLTSFTDRTHQTLSGVYLGGDFALASDNNHIIKVNFNNPFGEVFLHRSALSVLSDIITEEVWANKSGRYLFLWSGDWFYVTDCSGLEDYPADGYTSFFPNDEPSGRFSITANEAGVLKSLEPVFKEENGAVTVKGSGGKLHLSTGSNQILVEQYVDTLSQSGQIDFILDAKKVLLYMSAFKGRLDIEVYSDYIVVNSHFLIMNLVV